MSKTKVLFLAEELRMGGAETYFYALENGAENDIEFFSMAVNGLGLERLQKPELYRTYSFNPFDRVIKIGRYAKEIDARIIHCNSLQLAYCAVASKVLFALDCKIIYTKHNRTRLENIRQGSLARFVNGHIDRLIAICPSSAENLINQGIRPSKITTINNGVDLKRYSFQPHFDRKVIEQTGRIEIGILARLSSEKRHDKFLRIAHLIKEKHPNAHFSIAGDGPEREHIKARIRELKLDENVSMLGAVNAAEFLKTVDYLFLVSEREVLPMALIEGMATGTIVVAQDVGGVCDVAKPGLAYLVKDEEDRSYESAIELSLKGEALAMLAEARKYVEESFSLEESIRKHCDLYRELGSC